MYIHINIQLKIERPCLRTQWHILQKHFFNSIQFNSNHTHPPKAMCWRHRFPPFLTSLALRAVTPGIGDRVPPPTRTTQKRARKPKAGDGGRKAIEIWADDF